ncbi:MULTISPECIES: hypothetical protein [Lysinibacillus]|uniref:Uncharacterized protein n=1 Tax=Lysinibacillus antri TaxID=2498145 RepID=A0A432LCK7_9BACI|nr:MULTISPECIES: hypothetical protein [Lysinibacillus]RUL53655.1 hypothetical protein EK386_08810 [Lysinibacillus antri]TSI08076.1 hypothetical protein FJQ64_07755 [Lysinibacillus sp. BW-2-10]
MAKKQKTAEDFIHHIYIHMNDVEHFVIFSGLSLKQFINAVEPIKNLLLLKHDYDDGLFNMHTQFDFVPNEDLNKFVKEMVDSKKDLCWIDFENEKQLNLLTPYEQGELLYLGHKKEPIQSPFFSKLQNKYVFYSSINDKMTKLYFRFLNDTETIISNVLNTLIKEKEGNGSFWRRKSKDSIPQIDPIILKAYRPFTKEGVLLSLYKMEKPNNCYGIELRTLSDYEYPDEVWDDLDLILKQSYDELIKIS